jgi:hypothetical protein
MYYSVYPMQVASIAALPGLLRRAWPGVSTEPVIPIYRSNRYVPLSRPAATLSPLCGERAGRGVPRDSYRVPLGNGIRGADHVTYCSCSTSAAPTSLRLCILPTAACAHRRCCSGGTPEIPRRSPNVGRVIHWERGTCEPNSLYFVPSRVQSCSQTPVCMGECIGVHAKPPPNCAKRVECVELALILTQKAPC